MMNRNFLINFIFIFSFFVIGHAIANDSGHASKSFERIVWDKTPIKLTLKPGMERSIHFPAPVRVKPSLDLDQTKLRIQPISDTLHLKANNNFPESRLLVQMLEVNSGQFDGGTVFVLDLVTDKNGSHEPVKILLPQSKPHQTGQNEQGETNPPSVTMVELVRYASQQLYAPERLIPVHSRIHRIPLRVKTAIPLYQGGEVNTVPLATWKSGIRYVTALKITNMTRSQVIIDPRLFRGKWGSRTLQHASVEAKGTATDSTTVYLISYRPFYESLSFLRGQKNG